MTEEIYLSKEKRWTRLYSEPMYQGGRGVIATLYVRTPAGVLGRILEEAFVERARAEGRVREIQDAEAAA